MIKETWALDNEGKLDDITVPDVETFRMERMDSNFWWIGLHTKDGRRIHLDLIPDQAGIKVTKRED